MSAIAVLLVLVPMLAACAPTPSTTTSPDAEISQAQAVADARAATGATGPLISATAGPMHEFDPSRPNDMETVWAVVLAGTFPFSCGPAQLPGASPQPCPPPATSETVLLTMDNGTLIEGMSTSGQ